jgi:hypothetical protein
MTNTLLASALAAAVTATTAQASLAAGCETPLAAALRLGDTPYHMTMVSTDKDGATDVSEVITTGEATYVKVGTGWRQGPKEALTLQDIEDAAGDTLDCRLLRSEAVAGSATDVWQVEDTSDLREVKHQTVWIAKDTGLLLRMAMVLDLDGQAGVAQMSAEIDYDDVLPPR